MNKEIWFMLMWSFLDHKKVVQKLNICIKSSVSYKKRNKIIRNPSFPSELSEYLVVLCYEKIFNIKLK